MPGMSKAALTFLTYEECARMAAAWPAFGAGRKIEDLREVESGACLNDDIGVWCDCANVQQHVGRRWAKVLISNRVVLDGGVLDPLVVPFLQRLATASLKLPATTPTKDPAKAPG